MKKNGEVDDFIHVNVIPPGNKDLLEGSYVIENVKELECTWRKCLKKQENYVIISPKELYEYIDRDKHKKLIKYLWYRYWMSLDDHKRRNSK